MDSEEDGVEKVTIHQVIDQHTGAIEVQFNDPDMIIV